ncbi:MAG: hypothetical protein KTR16_09180 [Acidiferrobacterales bacterium]|nr:hypothetical protein [Acidiferrobacterales bacterium]
MKKETYYVALSFFTALLISACSDDPTSPEQQVRTTLNAMQEAAEQRSLSDFMQHVAEDYSDHKGNNKEAIKRFVQILFLRNQSINIFTLIQDLDIQDNIAAVEVSAAMAARGVDLTQESNRLKADTNHFSVVLQNKGDTKWQVQSVSWKRGWGNG